MTPIWAPWGSGHSARGKGRRIWRISRSAPGSGAGYCSTGAFTMAGRAIAQRAQMVVKAGQRTALANLTPGHEITARDVALAAQAGDAISQQLLGDAGRHIGSALASLINLLNPGLILIGGGVAEAGEFILGPIQEAVQQRSLRASLQATRIAQAALGRHSVSLGPG